MSNILFILSIFVIIETIMQVKNIMLESELPKAYFKRVYQKRFIKRMGLYGIVLMLGFILGWFNPTGIVLLVLLFGFVYTVLYINNKKDESEGMELLKGKQFEIDDEVIVNGKKTGKIINFGLTNITLETELENQIVYSYSKIRSIEQKPSMKLLKESLVLNFREDPKKALESLGSAVEQMNEKLVDRLVEENKFVVRGIVDTNSNYHGMLYQVEGLIKMENWEETASEVRYILANTAYENNLKMAETNVYYRTRMSSK